MLPRATRIQSRGFSKQPERVRLRDVEREPQVLTRKPDFCGTTSGKAVGKHRYVRSKALLAAVRTLPCQITGRTDGVEPAHANWGWGKGRGIKCDDNRIAAIHHTLHREIDQGHLLSEDERKEMWWGAHVKTVKELLARGLWPKGVPVPDIETYPW